jgi:hypothetical protein
VKFEYFRGLLYTELSIFHGSEVKLRAMIDTGSVGTAADIDKFQFEAIIGSELLDKLGAVIDYPNREIAFTKTSSI